MKVSTLTLAALFVPMLILGAYQAEAAQAGSIQAQYQGSRNGNEATFSLRITNTGSTAMQNVTVNVTRPTSGFSSARVCADNAMPKCTTDTASIGGSGWQYVSGSTSGGSGDVFNLLQVGTVVAGTDHTVTYRMHEPSVNTGSFNNVSNASNNASGGGTNSAPAVVLHQRVNTSGHKTHVHQSVTTGQGQNTQTTSNNETLPTVESNAGDVSADQTVTTANSTSDNAADNQTPDQTTDTGKGATVDSLSTSGAQAGMGALALVAIIGGAYYYIRSRKELIETLLQRG